MIVGVVQPLFMPYPGHFDLISKCDKFIFYVNAKFELQSWQCRNRIRTEKGWLFLTVPVKSGKSYQQISDVKIDYEQNWIKKHLKTIEQYYGKSKYFKEHYPAIDQIYKQKYSHLYMLNIELIQYFMFCLDIKTEIDYSDRVDLIGKSRNEKLLAVCKYFDTETYISSIGGKELYTEREFKDNNIELVFQEYPIVKYPQVYKYFIPELSILDLLFNCGDDSKDFIYS